MHAHRLEFDTFHGRWDAAFSADDASVTVGGTRPPFAGTRDLSARPLGGVDVVIDCTGAFESEAALSPSFAAVARKVVVSAPVKDGGASYIVFGVNHETYDPDAHRIVAAASCTANGLAPVVTVIHEGLGIRHGSITAICDVTNTRVIVDRPAKDLRHARAAPNAPIPTTTGSATAITLIYLKLTSRLNGHAVRVPLLNACLTDCVSEVERETSVDEVYALFAAAAEGPLRGVLGYETRPLASAAYVNDARPSIVDAPLTMAVNGTQVQVYAWSDDEWGYAHRLMDAAMMVGASL